MNTYIYDRFLVDFDPDYDTDCVVYYEQVDEYMTLAFIEEEDEELRFEDEGADEPMMSIMATRYRINHVTQRIFEVDGFCYRIRADQNLGAWFRDNGIEYPDCMFDLEGLENCFIGDFDTFVDCKYRALFL